MTQVINALLADRLKSLGMFISTEQDEKKRRVFRLECELDQASEWHRSEPHKYLSPENGKATWDRFVNKNGDEWAREWCGGTPESLIEDLRVGRDTSSLLEVKRKLASESDLGKLRAALGSGRPTRRRVMSEHDGEWDYDRRWELAPFSRTVRTPPKTRVLRIVAHGAANSGTSAKSMDAFGALVWSISELLEESGIQTEVIYSAKVARTSEKKGSASCAKLFVRLKKAGQYVSPGALAAALQTNFYRRLMFGFIILSADYFCEEVDSSLGRGEQEASRAEPGTLHLSCDVDQGLTPQVFKNILTAIGQG